MAGVFWEGLWTLIGLLLLITGQLSYDALFDFSKRQARIVGAAVIVFGWRNQVRYATVCRVAVRLSGAGSE